MFEHTDPNLIQLNTEGELKHFITTEGLSRELLTEILDTADSFVDMSAKQVKKSASPQGKDCGKPVFRSKYPYTFHI
jgi:aspartate carbamoyltransferase catalytic subunit